MPSTSKTAPRPASTASSARHRELWPALIVAALGVPLVFMFTRAMADGELRRREAPLRALLGDAAFEANQHGDITEQHYIGNRLSAPDFNLQDRHGKPWKLSDQRGKVVVMNFWTVTCGPCIEEMPSVLELAQIAQQNEDLEVVAVTTDDGWDAISSVIPEKSALTILFDPKKKVVRDAYGTRLFPETWVVDRRGVIRLRVDGPRDWSGAVAIDAIESFL